MISASHEKHLPLSPRAPISLNQQTSYLWQLNHNRHFGEEGVGYRLFVPSTASLPSSSSTWHSHWQNRSSVLRQLLSSSQMPRKAPQRVAEAGGTEEKDVYPWVMARHHNHNYSTIHRLPNEIIYMIIDCLEDDLVGLFCLRQACCHFRLLIKKYDALKAPARSYRDLSADDKDRLCALLRRDQLCAGCLSKCHYNNNATWGPCSVWNGCKFLSWTQELLYCVGCGCLHPSRAFSTSERGKAWDRRVCIGREGVIRLCKHKHIFWTDIEIHVQDSLGRGLQDHGRIPPLYIVCDEDRECHQWSAKGPRVSFQFRTNRTGDILMSMHMGWSAHRTLTLAHRRRFMYSELRSMFSQLRQAGARFIWPSTHSAPSSPLMEMECFGRPNCVCVSYERLKDEAMDPGSSDGDMNKGFIECMKRGGDGAFSSHQAWSTGLLTESILIERCKRSTPYSCTSLVAKYNRDFRDVMILKKEETGTCEPKEPVKPPHEWFHAVDPGSYRLAADYHHHSNVWPTCKKAWCRNYYRSYQTLKCSSQDVKLHVHCTYS
ncbi:hypothetical protein CONLIGDRAFT_694706 [Coniochaeta ligniaria NRRL 30616]|uniref:F-box domain-containing protein n=1 Tax=Coniochaeta ligniaria NRRL 30616 TaxID=1408157 RepID=A0A1J7I582_9PEZI|nr:hypothetical protein CONLIGDRAFT_694706 [Coniochaeta ligniaria NRRL 30616]